MNHESPEKPITAPMSLCDKCGRLPVAICIETRATEDESGEVLEKVKLCNECSRIRFAELENGPPSEPIALPVRYVGDEDAMIYDRDSLPIADLDSLHSGTFGDDSHPGLGEMVAYRNEVGEYIAKVLNEYPSLEQRLEVATKALERWKCTRCLGMSEWLKQGCPVCKGTGLNSIASTALSKIKGEAA